MQPRSFVLLCALSTCLSLTACNSSVAPKIDGPHAIVPTERHEHDPAAAKLQVLQANEIKRAAYRAYRTGGSYLLTKRGYSIEADPWIAYLAIRDGTVTVVHDARADRHSPPGVYEHRPDKMELVYRVPLDKFVAIGADDPAPDGEPLYLRYEVSGRGDWWY